MKHKVNMLAVMTACLSIASWSTLAAQELPKRTLKTNYQEVYNEKPKSVDSFSEMFSEGSFYGRLRLNSFYNKFKDADKGSDHATVGLGGSLIYKSAVFSDIDFRTGLYYSRAFWWDDNDNIANLKKGKDVLSRFDYVNSDKDDMGVLGQANITYSGIKKSKIVLGRQLVETFYTKSNDTKMIPNTFDGVVLSTKLVPDTNIKLAYLYKQKLRDHTQTHSVFAYGDTNSSSLDKPQWNENDDSAMHKGLTYTALKNAGKPTDAPLIVSDIKNQTIKNLNLDTSFYVVPELLSQVMVEGNYKIDFGKFSITPGLRYINQFDNGAGEVGGASYSKKSTGYKDPNSLDAQMIAARVVAKVKNLKINLGYSNVLDEADLITPWRGFPTAGYTRSMARYNWHANTQSYRLELTRNANKIGIYENIFLQSSILYTNADEEKGGKDEIYYYVGFVQNVPMLKALQWRFRAGYTQYLDSDDSAKNDLDTRFELNYLF
jgi:hypothetical protein